MGMDQLYATLSYEDLSLVSYDPSFDLFKSNVYHDWKSLGDKEFLKKHLSRDTVTSYVTSNKPKEALYLLSLVDHLCIRLHVPVPKEYEELRQMKLSKLQVGQGIYLLLKTRIKTISSLIEEAIPEFLAHNILEGELEDVR